MPNNLKEGVSNLSSRGIFTMEAWCKENGYDGVTKECVLSASQQEDPKLKEMAKKHLKQGIVKRIKGE